VDGTRDAVLQELQRGCDVGQDNWMVSIDSTIVRAHHHTAGARKEPPADVATEVLAVALAADLTAAVTAERKTAVAPGPFTGGRVE